MGRITSWSARGAFGTSASSSAIVRPVIVMQSPLSRPAVSRIFSTCGTPPARCRSTATYFPEGLRSHSTGTRWRMRSKSSMVHATSAAEAMARKCSTALVEPPVAITSEIAFSIDLRVMMSRGFRSFLTASTSTRADCAAESAFSESGEAICDDPSRLIPSASNADDIVLAVYIPPQAPTLRAGIFFDAVVVFLRHRAGGKGADSLER